MNRSNTIAHVPLRLKNSTKGPATAVANQSAKEPAAAFSAVVSGSATSSTVTTPSPISAAMAW